MTFQTIILICNRTLEPFAAMRSKGMYVTGQMEPDPTSADRQRPLLVQSNAKRARARR